MKHDKNQDVANNPNPENKIETTFLQIPIAIKDKVEEYIDSILPKNSMQNENPVDTLPSQGCFLILSLEKIEDILNRLEHCLAMTADNSAENIKEEIRKIKALLN